MSDTAVMAEFVTAQDVVERLGVPGSRIRLRPPPGMASEEDVVRIHDREGRLCELVDGVLVEKPMGFYESSLASMINRVLGDFAERHRLGVVAGEAGMLRLTVGLVRIPDVSFVSWDRLPGRKIPREPIPDLVPDLAVEVLSESNTPREMRRKRKEYFDAGVRLVWFFDPPTRTVTVYTGPERSTRLTEEETLDGGEVLPGFSISIREIFDRTEGEPANGS